MHPIVVACPRDARARMLLTVYNGSGCYCEPAPVESRWNRTGQAPDVLLRLTWPFFIVYVSPVFVTFQLG